MSNDNNGSRIGKMLKNEKERQKCLELKGESNKKSDKKRVTFGEGVKEEKNEGVVDRLGELKKELMRVLRRK